MNFLVKFYFVNLFTFFCLSVPSNAKCILPILPDKLELSENIFSLRTSFVLSGENEDFGEAIVSFFSFSSEIIYYDNDGLQVARGRTKIFSWGTQIEVFDCEDNLIGSINENVFKSFLKTYTNYSIEDKKGHVLAISEKIEWLGTEFSLQNPDGQLVAKVSRPYISWLSDNWTIEVSDNEFDKRFIVLIGAFKTLADNNKDEIQSNEEEERKK